MAEERPVDDDLWHEFLRQHHLGPQEQEDFLAFLRREIALPIQSMQDLEDDYIDFLSRGDAPQTP